MQFLPMRLLASSIVKESPFFLAKYHAAGPVIPPQRIVMLAGFFIVLILSTIFIHYFL